MDKERIQNAVREILIAVGEDPDREGLVETPKRVANMYEEIFAGLTEDPKQHIKLFNEQSNDEMVIVKDNSFLFNVRASFASVFRQGTYRLYSERQ